MLNIVPGPAVAETTIIVGLSPLLTPPVGSEFKIYIQQYDSFGNRVYEKDSSTVYGKIQKAVSSTHVLTKIANVKYEGNGNFSVSFFTTTAGQYSAVILQGEINIGSARTLRSPFQVTDL